jgi:hypothetical protein
MNIDRVLRAVEGRLQHVPAETRAELLDAVREEVARARRFVDPSDTLEAERERRLEAETLRDVLEAISRQARLEETIDEVLRQLQRVVACDSTSIGLLRDGECRVLAARGFADDRQLVGLRFEAPLLLEIARRHWPISLADVRTDERFVQIPGGGPIRSWAGLPLLVEGEVIGVLNLDRHHVDPFSDEDLHRARAVAFSAAAAIRKAQLLEQVRRYATLMEQVVAVDQAVFGRRPLPELAHVILHGALRAGAYPYGLLALDDAGSLRVAAAAGDGLAQAVGTTLSTTLRTAPVNRVLAAEVSGLGLGLPAIDLLVVPLATTETFVGLLLLGDPDGDTPADRLLDAYASRTAQAYVYARAGSIERP